MRELFRHIKGDKAVWASVAFLAIFSFLPVYSASSNLVYVVGNGSTLGHLFKHMLLLISGFGIIYGVHKIPYKYFGFTSVLMIPVVLVLLVIALASGKTIGGANASRWIHIPFVGIGFQPSTLASVVLMVFTARYLSRNKDKKIEFKDSFFQFWLPVGMVLAMILPANFSTTAIIFVVILMVMFIGNYPIKYIGYILGLAIAVFGLFILTAKAFPGVMPNRIDTWVKRIENFNNPDAEENYQVEKAKIAIATGIGTGKGFGKSVQKNFLPQSSSDFIFAIIVEETGVFGVVMIIFFYFLLLFRIVIIARKASTVFATLLVLAVGLPIIFQAMINMAVAVNIFPVTGQPLPLISSGGTSVWMTCLSFGIILSVSAYNDKQEEEPSLDENPLDILYEANQ